MLFSQCLILTETLLKILFNYSRWNTDECALSVLSLHYSDAGKWWTQRFMLWIHNFHFHFTDWIYLFFRASKTLPMLLNIQKKEGKRESPVRDRKRKITKEINWMKMEWKMLMMENVLVYKIESFDGHLRHLVKTRIHEKFIRRRWWWCYFLGWKMKSFRVNVTHQCDVKNPKHLVKNSGGKYFT